MRPNLHLLTILFLAPLAAVSTITGCDEKKPATSPAAAPKADSHGHDHGHDHGHSHGPGGEHAASKSGDGSGHGGPVIALGEKDVSGFVVNVTRDEGAIVAGKDAPIDVRVTAKGTQKVAAVRFWIGTQDGKGSVKAKGEIEDAKEPNRWHAHAEIPNPMPVGSRLWVEIEPEKGEKVVVEFDLKE